MNLSETVASLHLWHFVTRLGEAEILYPAALFTVLPLLANAQTRGPALKWLGWVLAAVCLTAASKLAFMGWGWGWAQVDFTGFSGHSMAAAAVYPVLALSLAPAGSWRVRRLAFGLGALLALLVGLSRLAVGAHSPSEVIAGLLLGGLVSAASRNLPPAAANWFRPALAAPVLIWIALTPFGMPPSQTHSWITRLALTLSGHDMPFTRNEMLRKLPKQIS